MRRVRSLIVVLAAAATGLTAYGAVAAVDTGSGVSAAALPAHVPAAGHVRVAHPKPVLVLTTHATTLGRIVASARGRTVCVFDEDHQGAATSACTGACRVAWPLVTYPGTARTRVRAAGVTGTVGSIAAGKGRRQVTLDGWPLCYYVGDGAPDQVNGQVNSQGSGGIWWVTPAGTRIT